MKRRRRLAIAAAVSALLCVGAIVLWVRSFRGDSHVSVNALGARYTLESSWGRVSLLGPPGVGPDDAAAAAIAARMSGDDFDWGPPVERWDGWRVRGDLRRGTPTWEMYERFRDRIPQGWGAGDPPVRTWLKALDNPRAFVPAHLLLALWTDRWRDATVPWRVPTIYVPVAPGTNRPLLDRRPDLRDTWYDRLATPMGSLFDGWLVAATLVVPVAWVARPRRPIESRWRRAAAWAFNAAAVVSAAVCVAGAAAWVRSYRAMDEWIFAIRQSSAAILVGAAPDKVGLRPILTSSMGRLSLQEFVTLYNREPSYLGHRRGAPRPISVNGPIAVNWPNRRTGTGLAGDRHWAAPGVEYVHRPIQQIPGPAQTWPTTLPQARWQTSTAEPLGPPAPSFAGPSTTAATAESVASTASATAGLATPTNVTPAPYRPITPARTRGAPIAAPARRTPPSTVRPIWPAAGSTLVFGQRSLVISWWLPVLLSAVLPTAWIRGAWIRRRQARARRDLCPSCGYDLRATPERCPECGAVPGKGADA